MILGPLRQSQGKTVNESEIPLRKICFKFVIIQMIGTFNLVPRVSHLTDSCMEREKSKL